MQYYCHLKFKVIRNRCTDTYVLYQWNVDVNMAPHYMLMLMPMIHNYARTFQINLLEFSDGKIKIHCSLCDSWPPKNR